MGEFCRLVCHGWLNCLYSPRPTAQGTGTPTVGWALLHLLITTTISHRHSCRPIWWRLFFSDYYWLVNLSIKENEETFYQYWERIPRIFQNICGTKIAPMKIIHSGVCLLLCFSAFKIFFLFFLVFFLLLSSSDFFYLLVFYCDLFSRHPRTLFKPLLLFLPRKCFPDAPASGFPRFLSSLLKPSSS